MRVVATHIVLKNNVTVGEVKKINKVYELSNDTYVLENDNGVLELLNNDEFHELEENYERYCKS
jgi:hypothetical protein